ncbi:MAG: hypothetical protein IPP22_08630 [Nitrosomonas sp.]|nr:hypothetical protein [Nitrosomonas sp.]
MPKKPADPDRCRWLLQTPFTADGGSTAKAIATFEALASLIRYAGGGHLPIDNNPVKTLFPSRSAEKLAVPVRAERRRHQTLLAPQNSRPQPPQWLPTPSKNSPWPNSRIVNCSLRGFEALLKECG